MTERQKDFALTAAMLVVLVLYFSKILFTDKIIRAPDITNEFLWTIQHFRNMSFADIFRPDLHAAWEMFANGGATEGGGLISLQLLFDRSFIFWLLPAPINVAVYIVVHLFFGGVGTYLLCRAIGTGRSGAFLAGLLFAVAPENATLINAGHVQKIATISFAPWAFYFLEKGLQSRRVIYFLSAAVFLAFQFFNSHWQIAFYTCLAVGAYGLLRTLIVLKQERDETSGSPMKLLGLNLVLLFFFLSTVAISLVPLADWSKDTTRGVQSGSNQGKGGLNVEEAMSWSMPPEELATFIVPGMFGLSRQEGGYNTAAIKSYYWGRMVFTQTSDYMGLLPWLLLPLAVLFRRDKYTVLALTGLVFGLLFSMGKYTPFYWFLYEHFPGINHFRVPKMMMIIPALCLGVLAARGMDAVCDEELKGHKWFRSYFSGLIVLTVLLLTGWGAATFGKPFFLDRFADTLLQPTRFEQGYQLAVQRWENLTRETAIAFLMVAVHGGVLWCFIRRRLPLRLMPVLLVGLFLLDTWRVNGKIILLQEMPTHFAGAKTAVMEYIAKGSQQSRTIVMNGADPMQYATKRIPVLFTAGPVQQQRWQNYLDNLSLNSRALDIMNVRYMVMGYDQYLKEAQALGDKFAPVFTDMAKNEVVLENRTVLPKAWLVPAVFSVAQPEEILAHLQNASFDPLQLAFVESPPPIPLASAADNASRSTPVGAVTINKYESRNIDLTAQIDRNSLLVLGEKYYKGWRARVDSQPAEIQKVNYILRGVYLTPGKHRVEFVFDPLPFKVGKWLTLSSFAFFIVMLGRELWLRRCHPGGM